MKGIAKPALSQSRMKTDVSPEFLIKSLKFAFSNCPPGTFFEIDIKRFCLFVSISLSSDKKGPI